MDCQIKELSYFPIKSLPGIKTPEHFIDASGLKHDRHWMLVQADGEFISQRQFPQLNTLKIEIQSDRYKISAAADQSIELPFQELMENQTDVTLWSDKFQAYVSLDLISDWFSEFLKHKVRFCYRKKGSRSKQPAHIDQLIPLNFVDGYPIHLINLESVRDLSSRCGRDLNALSFRANMIVDGIEAYAEDQIRSVRWGNLVLRTVKPCERCMMIGLEPGESRFSPEPLRTLARFRKEGNQVSFGIYLMPDLNDSKIEMPVSIQDPLLMEFLKK